MRTNIDIDDELMKQAMKATNTRTKKAAVEAALRKFIEVKAREKALEEAMKRQDEARLAAIREGRLDAWHAELIQAGTTIEEPAHADQH